MGARKYNGWYKVTKNTRFKKDQTYFIWTEEYGFDVVKWEPWAINEDGYNLVSIFDANITYHPKKIAYWRHPIIGPDGKPS